ncbi:MAG: hypothetical protein ACHQFW_03665 [Chitinophagales bacterium]
MAQRRIWIITIAIALGIFIAVYLLFFNKRNSIVLNAMPQDVVCFFDVKNAGDFYSLLTDNTVFEELERLDIFAELKNDFQLLTRVGTTKAELLSDLQNENIIAGAFASGEHAIDYLFLIQLSEAKNLKLSEFLPLLNEEKPVATQHKFERIDIYELSYKIHNAKISFAKVQGIFIFSTSTVMVENAILQLKKGTPVTESEGFKDVYDRMDKKKNYSFYVNVSQLSEYLSMFSTNDKYGEMVKLKGSASWLALTLDFKETGILLNGYASVKSASGELDLGNYAGEFTTDMNDVVPANTVVLYRINAEQLTENIASRFSSEKTNREYFDYWAPWMGQELIFGISESLDKQFMKKAYLIIPAMDQKLATTKLKYCVKNDSLIYREHVMMQINAEEIISGISGVDFPQIAFAAWVNNDLIITLEIIQLKNMIDAVENGEILKQDQDYAGFKTELSSSFNNSVYIDLSKSEQIIKSFVSDKLIDSVEKKFDLVQKFSTFEIQFSHNKNIELVNGFLRYRSAPQRKSGGLWKLQVDYMIEAGPFTVYNLIARQKNIIVQDTAHQLYLISANGDIIWKHQLTKKLAGVVHEVDFYGNNNSQILFSTSDGIYLLDMNGNPVEGFPITLTSATTNPLAVLMNTKNDYRMFVACSNDNIYGFYKDGKPIPGWNPMKNSGYIEWPLFAIRGKEEYIVYLNSRGFQVNKESGRHVSSISLDNKIIAIDNNGPLSFIMDAKGEVVIVDHDLKTKTISASDKFITGNFAKVNIDDTLDVLLLEDGYFKAKTMLGRTLFVAEVENGFNKIATTTFNGQDFYGLAGNGKVVLFSNDGQVAENFPVPGSENIVIDDLTLSGDKMLITVIDNMVIAYRIK